MPLCSQRNLPYLGNVDHHNVSRRCKLKHPRDHLNKYKKGIQHGKAKMTIIKNEIQSQHQNINNKNTPVGKAVFSPKVTLPVLCTSSASLSKTFASEVSLSLPP
mmetsp:Transcript_17426/g.35498  ORF Transcript_17426/g.35498 Transcript_17426/m.35498 type:complete len:104 (+) Transcript_17426:489-800(+)